MSKRKIARRWPAVFFMAVGITGLAGCAGSEADGKVEVELVSYKPEAVEAFEIIEDRFNESHEDIHLNIESPNEAMTILKTRFIREDYPEIVGIGGDINYSNFLDADLFLDISDLEETASVKQSYQDMSKELEFTPKREFTACPTPQMQQGFFTTKICLKNRGGKCLRLGMILFPCVKRLRQRECCPCISVIRIPGLVLPPGMPWQLGCPIRTPAMR